MGKNIIKDIENLTEEELLKVRIRDLPVKIEGAWIEECVKKLYEELEARAINFKPVCYLADEWLTPDKEPVIGIPFFLAHPALMKLEKQMMLDVEGATKQWCMKLLRHEAGHALNYAYDLYKKKSWQRLFGRFNQEYPDTYRFRPYSRNFVRHLEDYYAQYHPDEDFSETFAVWLTTDIDWQAQYKGWPALKKIKFVDELMRGIREKEPVNKKGKKYWQASRLTTTLRNYYKRKRHVYAEDFLDFHDMNLKRIFMKKNQECKPENFAFQLISRYRKNLIASISIWTGEKKYIVDGVLKALIKRSKALNLIYDSEPLAVLEVSAYVTTLMMNYMYTGRLRGEK
ncbi:MAG: hypothetical protein HY810_08570 [Candidatus Omnitrophica bacterium]|nr:hypothetical protein [Candidatus Omnitrophota bacterium]